MGEIERHTNEYCPVCGKWHEITTAGCAPDWPFRQQPVEKKPTIAESYLAADAYNRGRADALKECIKKINEIPRWANYETFKRGDDFIFRYKDVIAAIESLAKGE